MESLQFEHYYQQHYSGIRVLPFTWSDQRDRPKLLNRTQIVWPAADVSGN